MNSKLEQCPEPQTLVEFLLGKLPADQNQSCHLHVSECDPCVDTIRGLKVDGDTLSDLTREAWLEANQVPVQEQSESLVVENLIEKMQNLMPTQGVGAGPNRSKQIEDRTIEVQHLLADPTVEGDIGRLGEYRIVSLLGVGSTGVVYKAINEPLGRTIALKILRPSLGEAAHRRFMTEAQAAASLHHPNVVAIHSVGEQGKLAYLAMQWSPGETLEEKLEREGNLSVSEAETLCQHLALGLMHAHQRGLIHRDIKPANVWIPEESGVEGCFILDFGLVRITDEDPQLTCTGLIAGTPCYMSPEQSRGQEIDGRSDMFSLGCLTYQALTGNLPFKSDNALATLQSIQRDQPVPPAELDPEIPAKLSDLVMAMLEKSPTRRPTSTDALGILAGKSLESGFVLERRKAVPNPILSTSSGFWKRTLAALLAIGFLGFAMMFGPQITKVVTNRGEIEINSKDKDIQVEVLQNGERIDLIDLKTKNRVVIKAGTYQINAISGENTVSIDKGQLTIKRGEREVVTVTKTGSPETGAVSEVVGLLEPYTEHAESPFAFPAETVSNERVAANGKPKVRERAQVPINSTRSYEQPFEIKEFLNGRDEVATVEKLGGGKFKITAKEKGNSLVVFTDTEGKDHDMMITVVGASDLLQNGDTLGIFIDGVLGNFDADPPIHYPPPSSGLPPSLGYPVSVQQDGTIRLPLVPAIPAAGLSVLEVKERIQEAYQSGEDPILQRNARILVALMQKHDYRPPQQSKSDTARRTLYDLEVKLKSMTKRLGASHPDIMALKEQIEFHRQLSRYEIEANEASQVKPEATRSDRFGAPREESSANHVSLPMYNGMTYEQCVNIVRNERNMELLLPALKGMIELGEPAGQDDLLENFMEVARREAKTADYKNVKALQSIATDLFRALPPEKAKDLIVREYSKGTSNSRQVIREGLTALTAGLAEKGNASDRKKAVVEAIASFHAKNSKTDREISVALQDMQCLFYASGGKFDFKNYPAAMDFLSTHVETNNNKLFDRFDSFIMKCLPNDPAVAKRIARIIATYEFVDERLNGNQTHVYETVLKKYVMPLSQSQRKIVLPAVVGYWKTKPVNRLTSMDAAVMDVLEDSVNVADVVLPELRTLASEFEKLESTRAEKVTTRLRKLIKEIEDK